MKYIKRFFLDKKKNYFFFKEKYICCNCMGYLFHVNKKFKIFSLYILEKFFYLLNTPYLPSSN